MRLDVRAWRPSTGESQHRAVALCQVVVGAKGAVVNGGRESWQAAALVVVP